MAGIFPDLSSGGVVIRNADGDCLTPAEVINAFCPPETFGSSCEITALPSTCDARLTPAQINAIVSELLCLAVAFNPTGSWDCDSLCNLSAAFSAFVAASGHSDGVTIDGDGSVGDPFSVIPPGLLSATAGNVLNIGGDNKLLLTALDIVTQICASNTAGDNLASCLRSVDANNALALGADGRLFVPVSAAIIPPGMTAAFDRNTAPTGWLKNNGALLLRTTYSDLDAAIYCGDANNPTAEWGYRTNSTDTVRSTTGTHIRLRDSRGEFTRGWDDGRGVDSGRSLWAAQAQAVQNHTHNITDGGHTHSLAGGPNAPGSGTVAPAAQSGNAGFIGGMASAATGISIPATGNGPETRPRNQAALICIKY